MEFIRVCSFETLENKRNCFRWMMVINFIQHVVHSRIVLKKVFFLYSLESLQDYVSISFYIDLIACNKYKRVLLQNNIKFNKKIPRFIVVQIYRFFKLLKPYGSFKSCNCSVILLTMKIWTIAVWVFARPHWGESG